MARFFVALLAAAAVLLPAAASAADPGFAFLRLGAGARAAGLAEATTALRDAAAATTNPAALTDGRAVSLSHTEWIGDVRHEHAATTWALAGGTAAADVRLSHAGGLERRTGPSTDPTGEFGVYEWTAGLAFSRALSPRLRAGAGARFARQSIEAEAASGAVVDLGLLYGDGPWWIGAALRNLGRMNDLDREATDLPMQLRLGAAARRGPALVTADMHWTRDLETSWHLGAEVRPRQHLVLRAGWQSSDTRDVALGLAVPVGPWRVDYAWVPFRDGLGQAHRVSLQWTPADGLPGTGS
jgi:hypothetical protein